MRLLYIIVLLFLSPFVYGQKSVLLQNTNTRAKELKHHLNKTEDSIVFKCGRTIYELMIFNDDFERVIKVKDTAAKIQISDIPVGRYAVEAVLKDKLIIITLLRNESFGLEEQIPLITNTTKVSSKTLVKIDSLAKNVPNGYESNSGKTDLRLSGKKAIPIAKTEKEEITTLKSTRISNRFPLYKNKDVKPTEATQPRARITNPTINNARSNYWVIYKI